MRDGKKRANGNQKGHEKFLATASIGKSLIKFCKSSQKKKTLS
jgi:hypothetical protein